MSTTNSQSPAAISKSRIQPVNTKLLPAAAVSAATMVKISHHNNSIPNRHQLEQEAKQAAKAALNESQAEVLAALLAENPSLLDDVVAGALAGGVGAPHIATATATAATATAAAVDDALASAVDDALAAAADEAEQDASPADDVEQAAVAAMAVAVAAIPPCPVVDVSGPGIDVPGVWWLGSQNTEYLVLGKKLAVVDNLTQTIHICAPNFNVESENIKICAENGTQTGVLALCGDFVDVAANVDLTESALRDISLTAGRDARTTALRDVVSNASRDTVSNASRDMVSNASRDMTWGAGRNMTAQATNGSLNLVASSAANPFAFAQLGSIAGQASLYSIANAVNVVANPTSIPSPSGNITVANLGPVTGDVIISTLKGDVTITSGDEFKAKAANDVRIESTATEVLLKAPTVYVDTTHFHVEATSSVHLRGGSVLEPAYAEFYATDGDNISPFAGANAQAFKFPVASIEPQNIAANPAGDAFTLAYAGLYEVSWFVSASSAAAGGSQTLLYINSGSVAGNYLPASPPIVGPAAIPRTTALDSSGVFPFQLCGKCIIATTTPNAVISLRNPGANYNVAAPNTVDRLIIRRIDFTNGV